jgi:RES domain-containing protein
VKRVRLGPDAVFHRYLTPKWSHAPLSGAGAVLNGGRFNRPGVEALYLSRSPDTALAEYAQGSSLVPPATLAAYPLDLAEVADFSAGFEAAHWPPEWADWSCDWRYIARIERRAPPSWRLGDYVIRSGCRGLLFPSIRHLGGINLVVFNANLTPADRLTVHDPDSRLPRDQRSWADD